LTLVTRVHQLDGSVARRRAEGFVDKLMKEYHEEGFTNVRIQLTKKLQIEVFALKQDEANLEYIYDQVVKRFKLEFNKQEEEETKASV
jgi:hypothetical protein